MARADRVQAFREKHQYNVASAPNPEGLAMRAREHDLKVWPFPVKADMAADFQMMTDDIRPLVTITYSVQDTFAKDRPGGFDAMLFRGTT